MNLQNHRKFFKKYSIHARRNANGQLRYKKFVNIIFELSKQIKYWKVGSSEKEFGKTKQITKQI